MLAAHSISAMAFQAPQAPMRAGAVRMMDVPPTPMLSVEDMPGVTGPLGFFDPIGFSSDASEGKVKFYREVELKHGRVAMLAAIGFPIAEQCARQSPPRRATATHAIAVPSASRLGRFHPLFGGKIDVPSYLAFQETPLQSFWPLVVFGISIVEVFSVRESHRATVPWRRTPATVPAAHPPRARAR